MLSVVQKIPYCIRLTYAQQVFLAYTNYDTYVVEDTSIARNECSAARCSVPWQSI